MAALWGDSDSTLDDTALRVRNAEGDLVFHREDTLFSAGGLHRAQAGTPGTWTFTLTSNGPTNPPPASTPRFKRQPEGPPAASPRMRALPVLLALALLLAGCTGGSTVNNQPGAFSYSGGGAVKNGQEQFTWQNPNASAQVKWSGAGTPGGWSILLVFQEYSGGMELRITSS